MLGLVPVYVAYNRNYPDEAVFRDAAVKLNGGSKGRRNANIARDIRSRVIRSVTLYGSAGPIVHYPLATRAQPICEGLEGRRFPEAPFARLQTLEWG